MPQYILCVRLVAFFHMIIIGGNLIAVPYLIINEPFYIWLPMITVLVSPVIGSTYCMFNRLENHYRRLAGMELIDDRTAHFIYKELKYGVSRKCNSSDS